MLLTAVSVLVVAQSSSEIPEGLMNNPVLSCKMFMNCNRFTESFLNITMTVHKYTKIKFRKKCVMYTFHQKFQFCGEANKNFHKLIIMLIV